MIGSLVVMKLVWLHGAPAAGKWTVAKQLQQRYGFKLLHNHLAVDICLAIYGGFGEADFHDFADSIRRTVLAKAQSLGVDRMVMTYMVCGEMDHEAVTQYLDFFEEQGIEVYPVQLCPKADVLLDRVGSEERKRSNKISSTDRLSELLSDTKFVPIQHDRLLVIDNSNLSPAEAAECILKHLSSHAV